MKKGILFASILSMMLVVAASAAPVMLEQGHKSLGFQADASRPTIAFGWNIADMARFSVGGAWSSSEPQALEGASVESNSTWQIDIGIQKYLSGMTSERFAPYVGGSFLIRDQGTNIGNGFGFRGFFGVEAFVVENLSLGGNIGVQFIQDGDRTTTVGTETQTFNGGKATTTSSSAIMANIYW